jgi:hypothetical protein
MNKSSCSFISFVVGSALNNAVHPRVVISSVLAWYHALLLQVEHVPGLEPPQAVGNSCVFVDDLKANHAYLNES